jgi:hypothetical protein
MTGETIADPALRAEILVRLRRLEPTSPRQFGRMTPHQAICHLSDAFRSMMTPTKISTVASPLPRVVMKWVALRAPMKWPAGVKTMPEVDQEIGGTKPVEFARDRQELEALVERFATQSSGFQPHPMFGCMTTAEWHRWGWRHMDHHLRQFGV